MLLKILLFKMDRLLCTYLGLATEEVQPHTVQLRGNSLIVGNTTSYKRHFFYERWCHFKLFGLKKVKADSQQKLGLATGKAIAKNLVIYFEAPSND